MPARRQSTSGRSASGLRCAARRMALLLLSGLSFASIIPAVTMAQGSPIARPSPRDPYADHIAEASRRFGISNAWIVAVMQAESSGDVRAVSAAGAMGLMQIMPNTWADLRERYGLGRDPYDPHDNILAGTAYLRELWDRYGDVTAMLAAYNAGPARYDEHHAIGQPLPAETRAYVPSLVPALRGERPSRRRSAVAPPRDWREAALFVMRVFGDSTANAASPERLTDNTRSPIPAPSNALAAQRPAGLFVAPRDAGGRR